MTEPEQTEPQEAPVTPSEPAPPPDEEAVEDEEAEAQEPSGEAERHESVEVPAGAVDSEQVEALERAQTLYQKRVREVIGKDKMPPECAHCNGTGLDFTGGEPEPEFQTHDRYRECEACTGLGKVLTGSKVPGAELRDCPDCLGHGFVEKLYEVPIPEFQPNQNTVTPTYGKPSWMGNVQ